MLESLHLRNVGPAPQMKMDLAQRLNLITGDNGLGKSFLLDTAWWALTRTWARTSLTQGAAVVNSKTGALQDLVDPFDVKPGWFELNLATYRVRRGDGAPTSKHRAIDATLPLLNIRDCCNEREEYVKCYREGPAHGGISIGYLERRAPFVALELRRQGQLVRGDV